MTHQKSAPQELGRLHDLLSPDGFGEHAYCPPTPLVINQARTRISDADRYGDQHSLRHEIDDRGRWVFLPRPRLVAVDGRRVSS